MDLAAVLTPEIMAPILANAEVQERLMPYLPSGESLPQTAEEIQNTLTSPQFQQVDAWCWREVHFSFPLPHPPDSPCPAFPGSWHCSEWEVAQYKWKGGGTWFNVSTSSSFLQSLRGRWEWFLLFLLELGFTFLFTINALWQMTGVVADSLFPFNKWLLKGNFR